MIRGFGASVVVSDDDVRQCTFCGTPTQYGWIFPFNPVKKFFLSKPKYPITWLCRYCQDNNILVIQRNEDRKKRLFY